MSADHTIRTAPPMNSSQHEPIYAAAAVPDDPPPIPAATGETFAVAAGHRLAVDAAREVYELTGNAVDAAMASLLASAVVEPHLFGLGGEVSGLIHTGGRTRVLAGATRAPAAMTPAAMTAAGAPFVPSDGLLPASPPAVLSAVALALADCGSASFSTVAAPAIRLADDGFDIDRVLAAAIAAREQRFRDWWPSSAEVWIPDGTLPSAGTRIRQQALARTLRRLSRRWDADGPDGMVFELTRGFVATSIWEFALNPVPWSGGHAPSFIAAGDLAGFSVRWEDPVQWTDRHGRTMCKPGPWTQGPVLLQMMALMQGGGWDLLEPQTGEYLHAIVECIKLAFADREGYYGDPDVVESPLAELLDDTYAHARAGLVDTENARAYPPGKVAGGTPWTGRSEITRSDSSGDTTHLDVIDSTGVAISLTPSGGWFSSPVIPELGFPLGTRCQTFWLDQRHPNALLPGKRPRTTLTPTLVLERDTARYALGTPGGDNQDQIQAQILHALAWGMSPNSAVDLATVASEHHPSSFAGHGSIPLGLLAEGRVSPDALEYLRERGHHITMRHPWSMGRPSMVEANGTALTAAASRRLGSAGVWAV